MLYTEEYLRKEKSNYKEVDYYLESIEHDRLIVWPFNFAPDMLQKFCNENGGDEDWLIVVNKEFYDKEIQYCNWLERTDSCHEPDIYEVGDFYIFVGSHA